MIEFKIRITGNDVIHQLTREDNVSLYVSIKTTIEGTIFQVYDRLSISDEAHKYKLTLEEPTTGTRGKVFQGLSPVSIFQVEETGWTTNQKTSFALNFRYVKIALN